ncbi:N-acetylmuramoyl-L-alanine amidase [Rubritalea tangerina]|uniref:N-acetylmuramoyl-L-alanine amidase n=1 Tax=Rubritalea tangerina TaxID=430798 RepID=A0ABW4ZDQ8_9BACT
MPRKNLALEVALVVLALLGAFIVQAVISQTKPPRMPELGGQEKGGGEEQTVVASETLVVENSEDQNHAIPAAFSKHLSSLGTIPDWSVLDNYQYTVTKSDFVRLMTDVYSVGDYWKEWFKVEDDHVMVRMSAEDETKEYKLSFMNEVVEAKAKRYWRAKKEIEIPEGTKPLLGVRIAIDPGHIGGDFASVEQRRFVLNEATPPIQEGNMTLIVAEQLVDQLEMLGAQVTLVRSSNQPVNPFRPEDYYAYAKSKLQVFKSAVTEASVKREAQKLFYRNGEIRERARIINEQIRPDIVLCLHFNADPQPDPLNPILIENEHFHMILNGAYTKSEMAHDDERFKCLLKVVQGNHEEEAKLAAAAAKSLAEATGLAAYQYAPNSSRAVNVAGNPYLWGRNLIANRLFDCPVLYYEPYLMNGKDSFERMQVGDYEGLRFINGKLRFSIYREYVQAVTRGLVDYYSAAEKAEVPAEAEDDSALSLEEESDMLGIK